MFIALKVHRTLPVRNCKSTTILIFSGTSFIRFMGTYTPNHGYLDLTIVGHALNGSNSVQCHTDLDTCCSGSQGADRGDWYYPNGERLPFSTGSDGIYQARAAQRVHLYRRNSGNTSGIYCCTIETITFRDDYGLETVYVGLYASGGMYVCVCLCVYALCMCMCMRTHTCVCMCACVHACMDVCVYVCVCVGGGGICADHTCAWPLLRIQYEVHGCTMHITHSTL